MRHYLSFIRRAALCAVAAFAVFGCANDPTEPGAFSRKARSQDGRKGTRLVTFHATPVQTKAAFGEADANGTRPTLWTVNDSEVKLSLNYSGAQAVDVTPSSDFVSASFSANIDFNASSSPYVFYAVSPSSAAVALSPSREAWKVSIPGTQTPSALSVDEGAIIIAASSEPFANAAEVDDVDLQFYHLTAYGRMTLKNLDLAEGETLRQVELTFTTPVAGDWFWKCDAENGTHELIDYGASSTLTINTGSATDIWFGCAPVDVSGELMTVRAYTNLGVWERYVEFPSGRKFDAGQVAVFGVNMAESAGAEFTAYGAGAASAFTLVTDASTLAVGDEIIITNVEGTAALGSAYTSSSSSYRRAVDITSENYIITNTGDATVLTLRTGSVSGTWVFDTGDGYLSSVSKRNSLSTSYVINAKSSWSISIVNEEAAIEAQEGTYKYLRFNSDRFSGYSESSQTPLPAIYRRTAISSGLADPTTDALLSKTVYGCYLGTGLEWEYNPGVDQITRSYSSDGTLTFTLIRPEGVNELEITGLKRDSVKGDSVTVSVTWRSGRATVLSQTYNMSVIKEDGPKVWIGNGSGQGFIIKK